MTWQKERKLTFENDQNPCNNDDTGFTIPASRMRPSFTFAVFLTTCIFPAQAFQRSAPLVKSKIKETGALLANEKEDYLPEVSFGSEVVPDGQRPVNEYQDMMNAPLFGWGSNEVGVQGVSWFRPFAA